MKFSFFQHVFKVIQTLVFNQGTKSVHFSFVGMPLCSQRLKLLPVVQHFLTLILLTWRIWWAPTNASRWHMGFNSAFKGLMSPVVILPVLSLSPSYIHPSSNPKQLMLSGLLSVSNVNNPVGLVGLPYVIWSTHFFVTHIQTEKISSWKGPTVHVCCFILARASTKTFVSRVRRTAKKIFVSRNIR